MRFHRMLAPPRPLRCPARSWRAPRGPMPTHPTDHRAPPRRGLVDGRLGTAGRRTAPAPYFIAAGAPGHGFRTRRPMPSWAGSGALAGGSGPMPTKPSRYRSGWGVEAGRRMPDEIRVSELETECAGRRRAPSGPATVRRRGGERIESCTARFVSGRGPTRRSCQTSHERICIAW